MALKASINGKLAEELVKDSLRSIGCYVDECAKHVSDWNVIYRTGDMVKCNHLFQFPFKFQSQKGIKNDFMQKGIDKIPDLNSSSYFIEVKSISSETKDIKSSNKDLIGKIMYEYKQYATYFKNNKHFRNKEIVYYVLVGSCDKELALSYLEDYSSWYWMKERFHVVYLDELVEIFKNKIEEYNKN